jgi:hypothetical protein
MHDRGGRLSAQRLAAALEMLHRTLVLFGRRARLERAEIAPLAGFRIELARIETIASGFELANHRGALLTMIGTAHIAARL